MVNIVLVLALKFIFDLSGFASQVYLLSLVIYHLLAVGTFEGRTASTRVTIDLVCACSTILTRITGTLVDI